MLNGRRNRRKKRERNDEQAREKGESKHLAVAEAKKKLAKLQEEAEELAVKAEEAPCEGFDRMDGSEPEPTPYIRVFDPQV